METSIRIVETPFRKVEKLSRQMETSTRQVETSIRKVEKPIRIVEKLIRKVETTIRIVETTARQVETSTRKKFRTDHNTLTDNIIVNFGQNQAQQKEIHPNFLHICIFSNALTTQKNAKEQESKRTCYSDNQNSETRYTKDGTTANIGFMKLKKGGQNR